MMGLAWSRGPAFLRLSPLGRFLCHELEDRKDKRGLSENDLIYGAAGFVALTSFPLASSTHNVSVTQSFISSDLVRGRPEPGSRDALSFCAFLRRFRQNDHALRGETGRPPLMINGSASTV